MKSNQKLVLIAFGFIFAFSAIISTSLNFNAGTANKGLKSSAISETIHIIGNSGWVDFKNDGNCTGEGTYSNPYVIEDLVIDGRGSGNCINIQNSDVFFKIENCKIYNSGNYAGIRLLYVSNSQLINNNCSSNDYGIRLYDSDNNNISGNTAYDNIRGIMLEYSF